jgi:hypothetical protein
LNLNGGKAKSFPLTITLSTYFTPATSNMAIYVAMVDLLPRSELQVKSSPKTMIFLRQETKPTRFLPDLWHWQREIPAWTIHADRQQLSLDH